MPCLQVSSSAVSYLEVLALSPNGRDHLYKYTPCGGTSLRYMPR